MRFIRPAIAALMIGAGVPAATLAPAFAQTCVCPSSDEGALPASVRGASIGPAPRIYAEEPPPPLPDYDQPPMPGPGYYWTPGYWAYNNVDYYWVPGAWVEPPQPGLLWTPGFWAFAGGVYAFHSGYWGHQVGYYGGVNYGFGYFGRGYDGGRWDGDNFYYNTAVNNFGGTRVTNVYNNQAFVNNITNVSNVSYAGGPAGIRAVPTAEDKRIAAEPRIAPTALQRDQMKAASLRPDQFVSTNQGKPAIAATPRPVDFKAAVPAKAAGGPVGENGKAVAPNAAKLEQRPQPGMIPRLGGTPAANLAPGQINGKPGEKLAPAGQSPLAQPPAQLKPGEKAPVGQAPLAQPGPTQPANPLKPGEKQDLQQQQDRAHALQQQQEQQRQQQMQQQQDRAHALQQQQEQQRQQQQDRAHALQQHQEQQRQQQQQQIQLQHQQDQDRAHALQQQQNQQRQQQMQHQQEQDRAHAIQQQQQEHQQQQMQLQQQQQQERARAAEQQMQQRAAQQQQQMRQQMQQRPAPGGRPEKLCGQPGLPPCPH